MKLRVFKEDDYNKIVIFIYKISDDNKLNRIYLFNRLIRRLNANGVSPVYQDKLLMDLNIYEKHLDHPTNDNITPTLDTKDIMELDVIFHEAMLGSFYL